MNLVCKSAPECIDTAHDLMFRLGTEWGDISLI